MDEGTGRIEVVLFDTTIIAHAAEAGSGLTMSRHPEAATRMPHDDPLRGPGRDTTDTVCRLTFEEDVSAPLLLALGLFIAATAVGAVIWRSRSPRR